MSNHPPSLVGCYDFDFIISFHLGARILSLSFASFTGAVKKKKKLLGGNYLENLYVNSNTWIAMTV